MIIAPLGISYDEVIVGSAHYAIAPGWLMCPALHDAVLVSEVSQPALALKCALRFPHVVQQAKSV